MFSMCGVFLPVEICIRYLIAGELSVCTTQFVTSLISILVVHILVIVVVICVAVFITLADWFRKIHSGGNVVQNNAGCDDFASTVWRISVKRDFYYYIILYKLGDI